MRSLAHSHSLILPHSLALTKDRIYSFVRNHDIICHLSFGSAVALKNAVLQICQQSEGKLKKLYHIVAAGACAGL